jgi:hypothetical protein
VSRKTRQNKNLEPGSDANQNPIRLYPTGRF